MTELEQRILDLVRSNPGFKAKDIASRLGFDRSTVNSALYGSLRSQCYQNDSYQWFCNKEAAKSTDAEPTKVHDQKLANICHYYLDCLNLETTDSVSTYLTSKYSLNYAELSDISLNALEQPAIDLLQKVAADKSLTAYVGYPVSISKHQSKVGEVYFKIAPVFLYSVEFTGSTASCGSVPVINIEVVKKYSEQGSESPIDNLLQLNQELGLDKSGVEIDLDDLVAKLQAICPWPWQGQMAPDLICVTPPIVTCKEQGIFNRAIVISAERSPFTVGLESELAQLMKLSEEEYKGTALYRFVHPESAKQPEAVAGEETILEVLPMNTEQSQAIQEALHRDLTVVTGPPGTGKSQVVTNLLINAAWRGHSALFSSKNHKAVDVVESRANGLAQRPLVLRMGGSQFAGALAEMIEHMLSAVPDLNDREDYRRLQTAYQEKVEQQRVVQQEKDRIIAQRNQVDHLEQRICTFSENRRKQWINLADDENVRVWMQSLNDCQNACYNADKTRQSFPVRFVWPFVQKKRIEKANQRIHAVNIHLKKYGLTEINSVTGTINDIGFDSSAKEALESTKVLEDMSEYKKALSKLIAMPTLEDADRRIAQQKGELSQLATSLWKKWMLTQTHQISGQDRMDMLQFTTEMKLLDNTDISEDSELKKLFSKMQKLMAKMLPCWAVTSLSAKSRVPFNAGMFDMVIIDEASQCDVASVLPLLYRARKAVIIGDDMQLRHIATLAKKQDYNLLKKNHVGTEWSYSQNSLFSLSSTLAQMAGGGKVWLRDHFRSFADIIEYSNGEFYNGILRIATNYNRLRIPHGQQPGLRWLNIKGYAIRPNSGSCFNREEAQKVIEELHRLIIDGKYTGSIGVVTPFHAQADYIRSLIEQDTQLQRVLKPEHELLIDTVHKFQGDERDVMLFSATVAEGTGPGALGFLQSSGNIFNVAVTRARSVLVAIGDYQYCSTCGVKYLEHFTQYAKQCEIGRNNVVQGSTNNMYGRDYPSVSNPEQVSDWERLFYTALFDEGIHTIPQYQIDKYKLDLALISGEHKLDIEVDGELYHRDWNGELCYRDCLRNQRMFELGWDVKRFWVYQIRDKMPECIAQINNWLKSHTVLATLNCTEK